MNSVVSDNFIYETIDRATDSHQYRTTFLSEASSYQLGDRVVIPIPPIQNGFLNLSNTYLKVDFKADSIVGTGLDPSGTLMSHIGINSAFSQVNLLVNGNYIQHYQHYQPVFAVNATQNTDRAAGQANSITNGMSVKNSVTATNNFLDTLGFTVPTTGTATAMTSQKLSFAPSLLGIYSGVRHLPLSWLSSDANVEIFLTPFIQDILYNQIAGGTITGGSCTFTISLSAQIDVLSDNSLRKVQEFCDFSQGAVSWSDTQQRASLNSIPLSELNSATSLVKSQLITGVRPRKLLSVIQAAVRSNSAGNCDRWAIVNPYDEFQIKIGATLYPPRVMANRAEMTQHTLGCFNQNAYTVYNNKLVSGVASAKRFTSLAAEKDATEVNCIGIDLTQFDAQGDGLNTSSASMETQGSLVLDSTNTAAEAYELYTIKRFGVLYSVSPEGDMSISY